MIDLKLIAAQNQRPLNRAARAKLPQAWQTPDRIWILALARLGLETGAAAEQVAGAAREQVEEQVNRLEEMEPEQAMEYLVEDVGGGEDLTPEMLAGLTTEQAAAQVLMSLQETLAAKGPA